MSDRLYVMRHHRVIAELPEGDRSPETVMAYATGAVGATR
jgi:ABC-type sugar transport system ATPase subunit